MIEVPTIVMMYMYMRLLKYPQPFKPHIQQLNISVRDPRTKRLSQYWIYCLLFMVQPVKSLQYHPSLEKVSYNELDKCTLIIHYDRVIPQNVGCILETVFHMVFE